MFRLIQPLGGLSIGSRAGGGAAATALIYDTFTDTDTTALALHTIAPTNTPATSWTSRVGTWTINSNRTTSDGTGNSMSDCDAGAADVTIESNVVVPNTAVAWGLIARLTDSTHKWLYLYDSTPEVRLFEDNAGLVQRAGSFLVPALTPGTTHELKLVCVGNVISGYVDGVQYVTYASATFNNTATRHGLYAAGVQPGFDDFKVSQ